MDLFLKLRPHPGDIALNRRITLILQIMLVLYNVNISGVLYTQGCLDKHHTQRSWLKHLY